MKIDDYFIFTIFVQLFGFTLIYSYFCLKLLELIGMRFWTRLIYLLIVYCMLSVSLEAQEQTVRFGSPFDFPLKLSASFGELRSGHLHGGLDIKTEGIVGKPIHSIEDGYISRATVSYGGFGQAVYVTHPNGLISVYGHIQRFSPKVAKAIDDYQYAQERFLADLRFEPDQFPVKKGDIIAWSGNEGYSFGPHLHIELHNAETGERVDPMPYFKNKILDTTPPRATMIYFYPQRGEGVVEGSFEKRSVPVTALQKPLNAWGKIALGISANDYMDGTHNNYGVKYVTLLLDTTKVFQSTVSAYTSLDNQMINAWTDFHEQQVNNRWVMRSHRLPGNKLSFLEADEDGFIVINEEKDYHFTYILQDGHGNKTSYRFTIHGLPCEIAPMDTRGKEYLAYDRLNLLLEPGMQLVIPKGALFEDAVVQTKVWSDSASISHTYELNEDPIALNVACPLMIGVKSLPVADTTKYYIARVVNGKLASAGGKYADGWVKTNIHELGTYTVAIDTVPPKITPRNQKQWNTGNISFVVGDAGTGLKTYRVELDGQFELFGFNAKSAILSMKHPDRLKKGTPHELKVMVEDYAGNKKEETYTL